MNRYAVFALFVLVTVAFAGVCLAQDNDATGDGSSCNRAEDVCLIAGALPPKFVEPSVEPSVEPPSSSASSTASNIMSSQDVLLARNAGVVLSYYAPTDALTVPKPSTVSKAPASFDALKDAPLVKSKLNFPFYDGCAQRIDLMVDALEATPCGKEGTVYAGYSLVPVLISIAYMESNCGRSGVFMGTEKQNTPEIQINEAARLLCVGLQGKGDYARCTGNLECVLNVYTPPCRDGNPCNVNKVRLRWYDALVKVSNMA